MRLASYRIANSARFGAFVVLKGSKGPPRATAMCEQGCQFGFFAAKSVIFDLFCNSFGFFYFWKKAKWNLTFFGLFGELDFLCRFSRLKDDFGRFLATGRFLDTVSGHRMIKFHWKFCTIIYNFLFCLFHAFRFAVSIQATPQQSKSLEKFLKCELLFYSFYV